jgi:cytochrome c oxidase subunit 2
LIYWLFLWMVAGGAVVFLLVVGLATYATFAKRTHHRHVTTALVIGGGAAFPTIVLTGLLCYGLSMLPELNRSAPVGSMRVKIAGVRWWWRMEYVLPQGDRFASANELVLPVGQPVEIELSSEDVIHSFWVPVLAGKMDMIPGRKTQIALHPTREGTYLGACAEFCGTAHTKMTLPVRVVSADEFQAWVAGQQRSSVASSQVVAPTGQAVAPTGLEVFLRHGCSACHTINGTAAEGVVGPDLTHFGSRSTIGAGTLPNTRPKLRQWITDASAYKPGVHMPPFKTLSDEELELLSAYLEELQ